MQDLRPERALIPMCNMDAYGAGSTGASRADVTFKGIPGLLNPAGPPAWGQPKGKTRSFARTSQPSSVDPASAV